MRARLTLTDAEVKKAVKEHVERGGFIVSGEISLQYVPGAHSEGIGGGIEATVSVEPRRERDA